MFKTINTISISGAYLSSHFHHSIPVLSISNHSKTLSKKNNGTQRGMQMTQCTNFATCKATILLRTKLGK